MANDRPSSYPLKWRQRGIFELAVTQPQNLVIISYVKPYSLADCTVLHTPLTGCHLPWSGWCACLVYKRHDVLLDPSVVHVILRS